MGKKAKTIIQLDELKCRKRVLRRLGFATAGDVIELKGRVACEISSGDELLLTEMIFNGVFNDLNPEEMVSMLSCSCSKRKLRTNPKSRNPSHVLYGRCRKPHAGLLKSL